MITSGIVMGLATVYAVARRHKEKKAAKKAARKRAETVASRKKAPMPTKSSPAPHQTRQRHRTRAGTHSNALAREEERMERRITGVHF